MVKSEKEALLLKTIVVSHVLMECFDELEKQNMHRQKLKQVGKRYHNLVEEFINDVFDVTSEDKAGTAYIYEKSERVNELINKLL